MANRWGLRLHVGVPAAGDGAYDRLGGPHMAHCGRAFSLRGCGLANRCSIGYGHVGRRRDNHLGGDGPAIPIRPGGRWGHHPSPLEGHCPGVGSHGRDCGYAFGALLIGLISDTLGSHYGFYFAALVTSASGTIVAIWMYETVQARRKKTPGLDCDPKHSGP